MNFLWVLLGLMGVAAAAVAASPLRGKSHGSLSHRSLSHRSLSHRALSHRALFGFVLAAGLGLYALRGNHEVFAAVEMANAHQAASPEVSALLTRVRNNPQDVEAWMMLGMHQRLSGDLAASSVSFRQATVASQGNPNIMTVYAEALILEHGGEVTPDAVKALDTVLATQSAQPQALYLRGLGYVQTGNVVEGSKLWAKTLTLLAVDHPLAVKTREAMAALPR